MANFNLNIRSCKWKNNYCTYLYKNIDITSFVNSRSWPNKELNSA